MSTTPKYRHGGPVPEDEDESVDETVAIASVRDRVPVVGGLLVGVGAVSATYIVAVAMTFTAGNGVGNPRPTEFSPHAFTKGAWAVLMNLGAQLQIGGEPAASTGASMYWLFNFTVSNLSTFLVFGILVAAGYAVADCVQTDSVTERIAAGLLVVPAYLAFAVVFATLATWEHPEGGQLFAVSVVDAAVYAGVVVPSIFALLGGTLAVGRRAWLANRDPR